ncbi:uncharacterized protein [Cherax quadricarinatus]|uniref:uncharacterized protein n=1 Tax=Cherax quadricarinatus TaxID=27406 RepID=UPI002379C05A|nr:uncharacterized protein LOC128689836 [Cherax quadricarinatus]
MPIEESIVALGKSLGLEVSGDDVEELVEEDNEELTTDELLDHLHQHEARPEETASEEGREKLKKLPTSKIKEMCGMWLKVQTFFDDNHPNTAIASRAGDYYTDNVVNHFRKVIKERGYRPLWTDMLCNRSPVTLKLVLVALKEEGK